MTRNLSNAAEQPGPGIFPLAGLSHGSASRRLMVRSALVSWMFFLAFASIAQTSSQRAAVQLSATAISSPVGITLGWTSLSSTTSITIQRKPRTATSWSALATPAASSTSYTDNTVTVGQVYEYKVTRVAGGVTGTGYVCTGVNVPAPDYRGKLVLLVDNTFSSTLSAELQQLVRDLRGDGWAVVRSDLARTATVATVKSTILSHYNSDPSNVKAVFILGHLAVPYSGNVAPDGHSEHQGAWPCDGYYGELNGAWTDASVNIASSQRTENRNVPGDGKFDQSNFPSELELQVGRVDLYDMPAFGTSEVELMRAYLNKLHAFKVKSWTPTVRGLVFDNLQWVGNPLAGSGWRNMGPLVGPSNIVAANQNSTAFHSLVNGQSHLWTYSSGGGLQAVDGGVLTFNGAANVGTTQNYATSSHGGVFNLAMGSYFGDWDNRNNFLRAPLASGQSLTSCWSGIPSWYFHHMGIGENIGASVLATMNNSSLYTPLTEGWQGSIGRSHLALMGDPTLRLTMVAPPSNLTVTNAGGAVSFSWTASNGSVLGYYLYEFNATSGAITRLNSTPITGTSWSSGTVPFVAGREYMVRAVRLESSFSGSYFNLSLGTISTAQGAATADCTGVVGGAAVPGAACNDGNACTTNDTWNASCQCVGVSSAPVATITAGGSASFCTGGSVVLNANTGNGLTYVWRRNGTAISGATASSYTAAQAGSYTVQVTTSAGCSTTSTAITVTVNTPPTATISAGSATSFCAGGAVTLTAASGTGYTYQWRRDGTSISGATSASYVANAAGAYTVLVSANGCSTTSSGVTVSLIGAPSATVTPASGTSICSGSSVVLNANTGTGYTYVWRRNGTAISGATSSSYAATTAGSYTATITSNSCTTTSSAVSVTVGTAPSATITAGGGTTFCSGGSVTLSANTGTGLTYQWRRNGTAITGGTSSSYSAAQAGTYTVVVSSNGCSTTSAGTAVTVNAAPTASITSAGSTAFCSGGSVVLNASTGTGNTYSWRRNGTVISGATASSYTASQAGSYTVVVTAAGCSATSAAVSVTVGTPPTATITAGGATTFCAGGSVALNANTGTGLTYQWLRNGSAISGATGSSYAANQSGTYTVVVTSSGCSTTSTGSSVTVNAVPAVTCSVSGSTITTNVSGGTAPYTYSWSGGSTSSSFTASSTGSYTVTVTGANGCSATCSGSVTVASLGGCSGIRTEAQGTWGAPATSNNPASYMTSRFVAAFPAPNHLTIGCGTRLLRFTTPAAVVATLPTYGMPALLASGTVVNPGNTIANTMVGQLVALKLNVRFDETDAAFMPSSLLLRDLVIASGPFVGWTVQQLITAADQAIGGCSTAYTLSQLSTALANVNNGYDGGVANTGFLTCPASGMVLEDDQMDADDIKLLDLPVIEVLAMPNPFTTTTELVLTGAVVDGPTTIEVYSATGQRVVVLFSGVLDAAEEHRFRWDASGQAQGMYLYRVTNGDQVLTGRLLIQ